MSPPRDWEACYVEGRAGWDKGAAAPPLLDFMREHPIGGEVLVPGCGTGHDVRALAGQPGAIVTGLDLAPTAIRKAGEFERAGSERYMTGCFFEMRQSHASRFDWVVEHTLFCAIEPSERTRYVETVSTVLKPGGKLLAIFYLDPIAKQGPPYPVSREEIQSLFALSFTTLRDEKPGSCYPEREGREWVCLFQKPES